MESVFNNTSTSATCNIVTVAYSEKLSMDSGTVTSERVVVFICFEVSQSEELLKSAVNNRTRERNYFRLYIQLLVGEITEEEFNKTIEENEDDYVVSNDKETTIYDIMMARRLIDGIKDVKDVDDFMDLFSFNPISVMKFLKAKIE